MFGRRSGHHGPKGPLGLPPTGGSVVHKAPSMPDAIRQVAREAREERAAVERQERRDRFAMAAPPVLIGEPVEFWQRVQGGEGDAVSRLLAQASYRLADAMLAERDKETSRD